MEGVRSCFALWVAPPARTHARRVAAGRKGSKEDHVKVGSKSKQRPLQFFQPTASGKPMSTQAQESTLVSSPGKVLLAGGYLVLSPAYPGLAIGTDSRFYSLVRSGTNTNAVVPIRIHSPQFTDAQWTFHLNTDTWGLTLSKQSAESPFAGKSPFLCLSLIYSLAIALQKRDAADVKRRLARGLDIWILADNDFYSQRKGVSG